MEEGTKVGERWVKAMSFADIKAMMARRQKGVQAMMDRLKSLDGTKVNTLTRTII